MLSYSLFKVRMQAIENKANFDYFKKSGMQDVYSSIQLISEMLAHKVSGEVIESLNFMFFEFVLDNDTLFQNKSVLSQGGSEMKEALIFTILKKIEGINIETETKWVHGLLGYIQKLSNLTEHISMNSSDDINNIRVSFENEYHKNKS